MSYDSFTDTISLKDLGCDGVRLKLFTLLGRGGLMEVRIKVLSHRGDGRDPHSRQNLVDLLIYKNNTVEELLKFTFLRLLKVCSKIDGTIEIVERGKHLCREVNDLV